MKALLPLLSKKTASSKLLVHSIRRFILSCLTICFAFAAMSATFPVTNTYDSGPGSLRQAIIDVNAAGTGFHSIVFNVYGQITLSTSLPRITKSAVTIDGENKITLNANQAAVVFFDLGASNLVIKNLRLVNTSATCILVQGNSANININNIVASSTANNIDQFLYVNGSSDGLRLTNIDLRSGIEACSGSVYGRAFYFTGGSQDNLVMDSIYLTTLNNSIGCEAIVFRDASINGLTLTNTQISGFQNGIVLDHAGGPIDSAKNLLLRNVKIDSLHNGGGWGFYSDFVNSDIQFRNMIVDLNVVTTYDDGNYGIRFDNVTNGITLDSVIINEADERALWFNGVANNIHINNSTIKNQIADIYYAGDTYIRSRA